MHLSDGLNKDKLTKKHVFITFILIFLPLFSLIISVDSIVHYKNMEKEKLLFENTNKNFLLSKKYITKRNLSELKKHILFLKDQTEKNFNETINKEFIDKISNIYLSFSKTYKIFEQVRFIDNKGLERSRININGKDDWVIYPKNILQNKSSRYYFKETIKLEENNIFFSPMDLNVEKNKVEMPYNPVIRIGTPVFDENGNKYGILILNYSAENILEPIKDNNYNNLLLINGNGHFYLSDNKDEEWAFMFDNKKDLTFQKRFPDVWKEVNNKDEGLIYTKKGLFIFNKLELIDLNHDIKSCKTENYNEMDYKWIYINQIPEEKIHFIFSSNIIKKLTKKYYFIFLIMGLICYYLASKIIKNKNNEIDLYYYATTDVLTNVFNRRTGIELLEKHYALAQRRNTEFTVCFADVNNLKYVNDNIGHDSGDILIKTISNILTSCFRHSDIICRFGGDEFVIILPDSNIENSKKIWKRVLEKLEQINSFGQYPFKLSISAGFSYYNPEDNNKNIDFMIKEADQKMYENKQEFKKTGKIKY